MTIKMGLRCFLIVVVMIHSSFALECHNVFNVDKTTCDECIRCGGVWCSDPAELKPCRRTTNAEDDWCKDHRETATVESNTQYGSVFRPQYEDVLAEINSGKITIIEFIGHSGVKSAPIPSHHFNTSQPLGETKVDVKIMMIAGNKIEVTTKVKDGFCSTSSQKFEYVFVEVGMSGVREKVVLKYHVPCACGCSEKVEVEAPTCHGFGNLTCGSCQCNDNWKGKFCEICPDRGDTSSSCINNEVHCSGNGYCDVCNKCHCYNDPQIQGSQYFDADDNCIDICSAVNNTDCLIDCLKENQEGNCHDACMNNILVRWNDTLLEQEYDAYRSLWLKCSLYVEQGWLEYWATKVKTNIHIMRKDFGESGALIPAATGRGVTIPVVIGVIAAIAAAVAAAVGYVMWKGQGALPTAGSNYANIDPEDSVGVNPLYKPPTSSFKNPMYAAKS